MKNYTKVKMKIQLFVRESKKKQFFQRTRIEFFNVSSSKVNECRKFLLFLHFDIFLNKNEFQQKKSPKLEKLHILDLFFGITEYFLSEVNS